MIVRWIMSISFLKIGTTFAFSQPDGTSPVFKDCEKITVRIGAISVAQ